MAHTEIQKGVLDAEVAWNFQKFMIDGSGMVVDFTSPRESPNSEKIVNWIKSNNL